MTYQIISTNRINISAEQDELSLYYGLYINIDPQSEQDILNASLSPALHAAQVAVRYHDITKEFVLVEFLQRLGFLDPQPPPDPTSRPWIDPDDEDDEDEEDPDEHDNYNYH